MEANYAYIKEQSKKRKDKKEMAVFESWFNQDLTRPVKVQVVSGNYFSQDNSGNMIGVKVFNNGSPVALSGTVSANIIRADGSTVAQEGSISSNEATVTLPSAAYAIPGIETIIIKLASDNNVTTLAAIVVYIYRTSTDTIIDPGTIIPSVTSLILAINSAVAMIPADYTELTEAVTLLNAYMENDGRTTICVPLGDVKTDTIITKGTGTDRAGTGSGNNFVTKGFIPVPKGTFYVISKLTAYYIAGYSANFEFMEDIGDETSVKNIGIQEVDNSTYGFSYIRIGFYSSGGYSESKYGAAEVLYYTDAVQKSKEFIMSQRLGPYTINTSEGISTIEFSNIRIGQDVYLKADKNIEIIRDGNSDHNWRFLLMLGKNPTNNGKSVTQVYYDWNNSTQAKCGAIIPKGAYYSLGYSYGTDTATNVDTAIKEAPKYIHIRELEDNKPGFYSFGTFDVFFTFMTRVGIPDKLYANTDLFLVSKDDDYVFSLKLYNNSDWDSAAWTAHYSVRKAYVPKGTWFRYNVGKSDGTAISESEVDFVFSKVGVYENWNSNADMAKLVFGLQSDLSAVRRRISALESDGVPSYYETHIATKVATINGHKENMITGDQFIFITDPHINGYGNNTMNAKPLINYICRNTTVKKLFNGGDLFNSGTGMSAGEALDVIQRALIYTQPDDCDAMQWFVMGNHDLGYDWPGGTQYGPSITTEQLYRASMNDSKRSALVFDPNSDSCFYFDRDGIRYIVSNFGVDTYTGESIGNTYLFISKAVKSATTPIVIIQHILWNTVSEDPSFRPYRLQQLENIVDACNSRGTCQYGDGADYIVDFANSTGRVCCIIGGHIHEDRHSYTEGGVPIIATTTDCWGAEYNVASTGRANAAGTVNEQAFDVFTVDVGNNKVYATRIGYGSDREFDIPTIS